VRTAAIERLLNQRVGGCTSSVEKLPTLLNGGRVRVASELIFIDEVPTQRQAEIQRAGNDVVKSALSSIGLSLDEDASPGQAVVEITAIGTASGARYVKRGIIALEPAQWRYSAAKWKGVLAVRLPEGCVYSEPFEHATEPPESITAFKVAGDTPSDAPFREVLAASLAKATVRLAQDLFGQAGISRVAKTASDSRVRAAAIEKLTDQALLADIAKTDGDSEVRDAAQRRLEELKAGR